jgi:hypothetical protein
MHGRDEKSIQNLGPKSFRDDLESLSEHSDEALGSVSGGEIS